MTGVIYDPEVIGGAELQEGDVIVRIWIVVDAKIYPGIPIPEGWRRLSERTVAAECCDFVNFIRFVVSTCQALQVDLVDR